MATSAVGTTCDVAESADDLPLVTSVSGRGESPGTACTVARMSTATTATAMMPAPIRSAICVVRACAARRASRRQSRQTEVPGPRRCVQGGGVRGDIGKPR